MSDYASELPIRSQLPGQSLPDDIIIKIGDGTNPTTQFAGVDTHGSLSSVIRDVSGNAIGDQLLSATYWLQATLPSVGPAAAGTSASFSDLMGGQFNTALPTLSNGQQSAIQVDSSGRLLIGSIANALPAGANNIGSVNQGTSPWIVKDQADGPVTPGTVASFSQLAGGQYNSAAPTLTTGQQSALQLDANGNLKVSLAAEPLSPLLTSDAADGAITNGATGTKAILGGAQYLSAAPTLTTGNMNALLSDVNGNLLVDLKTPIPAGANVIGAVTQSGGPWTSNITQVGGSALALGQTTMSASIPVTFASNQSALTVNQGTSPWVTSDLADGSVTGGTAGTKSLLGGGIYNTAAPTLTNGQQASLQLDVNGNLKVDLITPIPAGTNAIGSVLANLQVAGAPVTVSNPVPVTITSGSAGTPIQQYLTTAALAKAGTTTLTYTVPALHSFSLERIWATASGKIKVVVSIGATTIFVAFNSTANPNIDFTVTAPPTIAAAGTVNIAITNLDNAAMDVYATVEGNQIT